VIRVRVDSQVGVREPLRKQLAAGAPAPARCGRRAEAEQIDLLQPEGADEEDDVAGHVGHVVGHDAGRCADTAVGEQDDFAILGDAFVWLLPNRR
jgi:hypothetical protein